MSHAAQAYARTSHTTAPLRQGLTGPGRLESIIMNDMMSILSSGYKAVGSAVPSKTKYVAVDPALFEGTWTGTYANKKTFTITVSDVSGFRAQVKYQSGG